MWAFVAASCLLSFAAPAAAASQKKVLILVASISEGPAAAQIIDALQSEVRASVAVPVHFSREAADRDRFRGDDRQLALRFKEEFVNEPPDVVVAVTSPALDFVLKYRDDVFRGIPVVFGFVDERMLRTRTLGGPVTGAFVKPDLSSHLDLALKLHPAVRQVLVIGGTSDFDRAFQVVALPEVRRFLESKAAVKVETDLSLRDLLGEVAMLPDDSLVLYLSMSRDAAGTIFTPVDVLRMLRRVARVPIYSPVASYFGNGIVGGSLVDTVAHGSDLGRIVSRILAGERASGIKPVTTRNVLEFDGRELARLAVRQASLPSGAVVLYRQPGFWALHRLEIIGALGLVAAQSLLIGLLLTQRRTRTVLKRDLDAGLQFGTLLADVSAALVTVDAQHMDAALRSGLERIRLYLDIDRVSILELRDGGIVVRTHTDSRPGKPAGEGIYVLPELPFVTLRLTSLQPFLIEKLEDLPADAVRERAVLSGIGTRSLALIPLEVGGEAMGALVCLSQAREVRWPPELVERLRTLAEVLANALKRRKVEVAMTESSRLNAAVLSSMPAHIAVVDRQGVIITVNGAWTAFARSNGVLEEASISPGASYYEACRRATASGDRGAADALEGIKAVCDGQKEDFEIEYRCDSPDARRWFSMRVVPLRRAEGGAVVTHRDMTDLKRHVMALAESERRHRDLSGRLIYAQEAERCRIARELHDDLQQRLAVLAIGLDGISLGNPAPGEAVTKLARDLWRLTTELSSDVQRLAYSLHPSKLEALGLLTTIGAYCRDLSVQALPVTFAYENVPPSIPAEVSLCLFRVLQESLQNVRKHSGSRGAQVTLSATGTTLRLEVADTGRGFDATTATANGGLGLIGMRERLYLLGGQMTIVSAPGQGTRIQAWVPLTPHSTTTTSDSV